MRFILPILLLLLLPAGAKANECIDIDKFNSAFSSQGIQLYGSRAAASEKLAKVFNENRTASGGTPEDISLFLVGYIKDQSGEIFIYAIAVGKDGCVIPSTFAKLKLRQWVEFLIRADVKVEDFVGLDGA